MGRRRCAICGEKLGDDAVCIGDTCICRRCLALIRELRKRRDDENLI